MKTRGHYTNLLAIATMMTACAVNARADKPTACPSNTPSSSSASSVNFEIDSSDVTRSIWADGTISVSLPLENRGNTSAVDVIIKSIQGPPSSSYLGPTPFPYALGTMPAGSSERLNALLSSSNQFSLNKYPVIIKGTYKFRDATCPFQANTFLTPEPRSTSGTLKTATSAQRFTADTAVYPPAPPPIAESPNAENEYVRPLGPVRYLFATPPVLSDAVPAPTASDTDPSSTEPSAVVFARNHDGGAYGGLPPDPSAAGAAPNGFVMITANTAVSISTDFGKNFTTFNLTQAAGFSDPARPGRTDFFPESDGGLCCDQVVTYVPGRNLMVWLLQYWSPTINVGGVTQQGQNRIRIAWATPQAAAADFLGAWSWFDVSPTTLGDTVVTDWMDYPDLAYSNDWLYISVDHGIWTAKGQRVYNDRRWFIRTSLTDMVNSAGNVNLVYYEPIKSGLVKAHFAQSSLDTMYYAALPDSSTLSVFADPDSSDVIPNPKDIPISSSCASTARASCDFAVTAPDNLDWNVAPHGVLGATYVAPSFLCPPEGCSGPTRFLYFAFDAGRDNGVGRPFPYVRVAKLDADALTLVNEYDIWNDSFAFATPALVWRTPSTPGSGRDEVAFSLARGGGGRYADNGVGLLGEDTVYVTTSSDATQTQVGNSSVRYGDYFNVRNATGPVTRWGQGVGYGTAAYSVSRVNPDKTCAVGGCNIELHYIMFGRREDLFPSEIIPDPR